MSHRPARMEWLNVTRPFRPTAEQPQPRQRSTLSVVGLKAGTGADQANATAGAPTETTAPTVVFHDRPAHAVEPSETILDPTCATQVDPPTAPGVSEPDEPLPEVVDSQTSAMPNDAVRPLPDDTPSVPAQFVHPIEPGEPIFAPTGTPQSVPPAPPDAIEVEESPASAFVPEPQAPVNDAVVPSPSSTNEPGQDPGTVIDVRDADGSTPQVADGLPGAGSMATIDEPDVDAAIALQEMDAAAKAVPDDSEIGGAETEQRRSRGAVSQKRASPSERRPEPSTEYTTLELPPPSDDYRTWNRAIAEHLLFKSRAGSDLYLTITPRILARAWAEVQGATLSAEEAQQQFADAVSQLYRARVVTNRGTTSRAATHWRRWIAGMPGVSRADGSRRVPDARRRRSHGSSLLSASR